MKTDALVELVRHRMDQLLAIQHPERVHSWKPTDEERGEYIGLARGILRYYARIKRENNLSVSGEAKVEQRLPPAALSYLRTNVEHRIRHIEKALQHLDPNNPPMEHSQGGVHIRDALEVGLGYILAQEDPQYRDDWLPSIDAALEHLFREDRSERTLIDFDPDAWIERMGDLRAIRIAQGRANIPKEVSHRLYEVYRTYVLGSWLSVIALARSVLEYALHDRAPAFNIATRIPNPDPNEEDKWRDLYELIKDFKPHFNSIGDMHQIRINGNKYLHASQLYADQVSRQRVLSDKVLREKAHAQLQGLVCVLEDLYAQ